MFEKFADNVSQILRHSMVNLNLFQVSRALWRIYHVR